jgi:uncharacterized protein
MKAINRYFTESTQSYFLFGPRGIGKTTWLKQFYPDAAWIDLLDAAAYRAFMAYPERLHDFVQGMGNRRICVIDEIQRVPELLPMVHKIIEENKTIRFVLTGSSARKLKQSGVDLLAGRAVIRKMHPFMASELGSFFTLQDSLNFGMIPLVRNSGEPLDVLKGYINLYLEQEIKAEGIIRNVDDFARFLEAISFSQGGLLNISEVARECQVKRTTVNGYIEILEDLLISHRVPVFTKRAKRETISHSKFYFFDCGVFNSLIPKGPLDINSEIDGQSLEGLVLQHLLAWIDYSNFDAQVFFWRTRNGSEVDFIVYGTDIFAAIEVKNTRRIKTAELRPLKAFFEDYPESTPLFLYRGNENLMIDGIMCQPVNAFLRNLVPRKLPW